MRKSQLTSSAQISILTVDDDPIITTTIKAYFGRSGYDVDIENNPVAAIERVRSGKYDILLLDFLMSPICGDQVVERCERTPGLHSSERRRLVRRAAGAVGKGLWR